MDHRDKPRDINELKQRNLSVECPYCHLDIIAEPVTEPINDLHDYTYFVALCPHHKDYGRFCKPFFVIYQSLNDCIIARYPIPSYEWTNYHESIPDSIRKDFAESMRCLGAEAYKSTVALCRRVIEAICYDKLGNKIKQLKEAEVKLWILIDKLKEEGFITEILRSTAHEIRHLGNYGAHFQNDGLDEVNYNEAKEIREFTSHLLNELYIIPHKTAEMKNKRKGKE